VVAEDPFLASTLPVPAKISRLLAPEQLRAEKRTAGEEKAKLVRET
jgi:hypothetical protein